MCTPVQYICVDIAKRLTVRLPMPMSNVTYLTLNIEAYTVKVLML